MNRSGTEMSLESYGAWRVVALLLSKPQLYLLSNVYYHSIVGICWSFVVLIYATLLPSKSAYFWTSVIVKHTHTRLMALFLGLPR